MVASFNWQDPRPISGRLEFESLCHYQKQRIRDEG